MEPVQVLPSRNGGLYAFRTRLGWCVLGPVSGAKKQFSIMQQDSCKTSWHKVNKENNGISQEDPKFMPVLNNGTRLIDGHYEIPLSLRDDVRFPNNRLQAEKRFTYLQRKMSRNHKFPNDYRTLIKELISKGYATESTAAAENGKCWYLPHHEVYNQNKAGKIRIAFNLSAEFQGTSISKSLLHGTDFANQMVVVLLRFREEPVVVTGDLEAM